MNNKRVLITGASGFVGANLCRRLLRDGHDVHLALRPGYRSWRIDEIKDQVRLHLVDLADAEAARTLVQAVRPEWIFHLAVHGAYSTQTDIAEMIRTNLTATVNLLESCRQIGFEAFINTGSSSEYGYKNHPPREDEWLEPNSEYAVTKASATLYCRFLARKLQLPVRTLRLYSVYGPYEEPARLIPALAIHGLEGKLPPLVHPAIARDYIYSDDVNEAFVLAATRPGQEPGVVYNVGSGCQTSLAEVVAAVRQRLPIPEEPRWGSMPERKWDTGIWVADSTKLQQDLGWTPRTTFAVGFAKTVEWLRQNPEMLSFYRKIILKEF